MSGHSRWANIQHRKNRQDAKRAKLWTKIIHEITIATRIGGTPSDANPRLRIALNKAADLNVPKDNIQKAIQRGLGHGNGINYEDVRYEGYSAGGGAIIIDCLTDNRTRTVSNIKYLFTKFGGKLGQEGCVIFLFKNCGQFLFSKEITETKIIEIALDAGADDVFLNQKNFLEVLCSPENYMYVYERFCKSDLKAKDQGIIMKPLNKINLADSDSTKAELLLNSLENLEDVHAIYTNF